MARSAAIRDTAIRGEGRAAARVSCQTRLLARRKGGQDSEAGLTHGAPVPSLQRTVQGGDHDDTGNDTECEEVYNEIQAAAVGEGEYGGIYDGDEDDVISALLALAEA